MQTVVAAIAAFVLGVILSAIGNKIIYDQRLKELEAEVYGLEPDTAASETEAETVA